jgi:hypothetical protein
MYPLNMKLAHPAIGFATANDATEHKALTNLGYLPPLVKVPEVPQVPAKTGK